MGVYREGLESVGHLPLPPYLSRVVDRVSMATEGFGLVRRGENRFYGRGLGKVEPRNTPTLVGAKTPGFLGTMVDASVTLAMDLAHILLVLAGMYFVWKAITG